MTRGARAAAAVLALAAVLGAGLRLARLEAWPPGPWIDEAYGLRAARLLPAGAPLFGTTALTPASEGFVNAWIPNLYLVFARAVDVAAGGGLASFRALSALPALALLAALLLLAAEAGRGVPLAAGASAVLGATSMWLLTTGRWGWVAVATSALATLAAWAALRAARTGSVPLAAVAGARLGLGAYGYASGALLLAAPALVLAWALAGGAPRRPLARLAAAALLAEGLVVGPLAAHYARHPDRFLARAREVSLARPEAGGVAAAAARNVAGYAALFVLRGDVNERHGDPGRPVLPAAVSGLALVGAAAGVVRGGPARLLSLGAALVLLGGLLAWEAGGPNAYRVSAAAPFLVVLAGLGAAALAAALPERLRTAGALALAAVVLSAAATDVAGFVRWGSSARTWGAFGGPERELADAIRSARTKGDARVVLDLGTASRNGYVVEELLAPAGARTEPAVYFADLSREPGALRETILYADGGALEAAGFAGRHGTVLARGTDPWGRRTFTLYRLSP